MTAGRPTTLRPVKHRKPWTDPGRYEQRQQNVIDKKQKLKTLNSLIEMYYQQRPINRDHLRKLKRRANEVRSQLRVLSTVQPNESP